MKNWNWMKMILFLALPFLASLFTVSVQATDIPLISGQTTITPGQTQTFSFQALSQQNAIVSLTSTARLDYPTLGGSTTAMTIKLNNKPVNGIVDRCVNRLIGKNSYAPITSTVSWSWFADNSWRVVYAPDFNLALGQTWYQGNPYVLTMDFTDLINSSSTNQLAITNSSSTYNLVISGLTVSTVSGTSSILAAANAPSVLPPVINNGTPAGGSATYSGQVLAGGGFTITVGQRQWQFSSAFSYPNLGLSYPNSGQRFNKLVAASAPDQSGQAGWTVSKSGNNVTASGTNYSIQRSIQFTPRKIIINDTITNTSNTTPLGLEIQHKVSIPTDLNDPAVRLAGRDIITTTYYSPPNPSVHITDPLNNQSLGILCEDDVFRNQATLFLLPLTPIISAGIKTDKLYIGPSGNYTLQWSVYPVASQDYYDFVNLVRQDWGANFTVDGAWAFSTPEIISSTDNVTLQTQFDNLGIKYVCLWGGWVDSSQDPCHIGFGADVMNNSYWTNERTKISNAADKIHQISSGVKLLGYFNSQRDTSSDQSQFQDSWLTDANGIHSSTLWGGAFNNPTWSMVGVGGLSFGQAMVTVAGNYMDVMHTDGLYWDEMEAVGYGSPLITYNIPDGRSCLLTSNYTVSSQIGITQLLGESNRQDITAAVNSRNGMILGNSPAHVRALLTGHRMVETQHNDYWHYEGNMGSMLGYLSSYDNDFGKVTRLLKFAALPVGTSLSYTYQIFPFLFPFTPIEMHYGYLLGQERIITLHGGNYGWPGLQCLIQVHDFDANGMLTATDYSTTVSPTETQTALTPAAGGAVVLVKLPVTLDPSGATATVSGVSYTANGLQLNATVPNGATLQISNGLFPIQSGAPYMAKIGTSFQRLIAGNGILTVTIPSGFNIPVQVWVPTPITVINPSFESPAIPNYTSAYPTGWSATACCIRPVIPTYYDYMPDNGAQVVYISKNYWASINQTLSTVQPGQTYIFTASVGHARYDTHYIGYEMDILLNGVVISSIKGLDDPGVAKWFVKSVSYTTQTGDAGKTLSIQLKGSPDYNGGTDGYLYTEFDNIFVDKVIE